MTERNDAETLKISTPFGSMFLSLAYARDGQPVEFNIDMPQKLEQTSVGVLLEAIADAATRLLRSAT
jgi:hypothetical protein